MVGTNYLELIFNIAMVAQRMQTLVDDLNIQNLELKVEKKGFTVEAFSAKEPSAKCLACLGMWAKYTH